jgi:hypothetical protein
MNDGTDGPQTGLPAAQTRSFVPFDEVQNAVGSDFHPLVTQMFILLLGKAEMHVARDQVAQRAATEGGVAPTLSGAGGEIARLREALTIAETYVELVYQDEGGEEAAAAKQDLDMIRDLLRSRP